MKFRNILIVVFAISTLLGSVVTNAAEKLRIATEGAFPPFNYIEASGNLAGFDVDFGHELCKRMERECDFVAQDWDGIIPGLLAKKYDVILASMFITQERKKQVAFTDPYYASAMTHVAPKDSGLTDFTKEGMADKVIGAQSGATQGYYIEELYTDSDIRLYGTQDEVNLDMANGRLDLFVGDVIPSDVWVKKTEDGACCELVGEPITDPKYVGDGTGIAVRKEDQELLAALNKAIAEILADGTYKTINDKYFDINVYTMKEE